MSAKGGITKTSGKNAPPPNEKYRIRSEDDLLTIARCDLQAFSYWPLGYKGGYELWDCQKKWQELVQNRYEARLKDKSARHLVLLGPSEHGKTYGVDVPFVIWVLGRNRNLRIIVAGSREDLAQQVGHVMDRFFKTKTEDLAKFGLFPAWPWNAEQKYLSRDDDHLVHPSIQFIGPESEAQGQRADVILLSDAATHKNQRNPEARQKFQDWLDHVIFPRLEPWGFILATGHHVHAEDIYTELEARTEEWEVVRYRAILEEPCEANGGKGKVLAPEQWTYEQLHRIRTRRPSTFQLMYQNVPVETRGIVNREILERQFDRSRKLLNTPPEGIKDAYPGGIHIGLDPAFTLKHYSSFSACTIWGVDASGREDLLGGWRSRILSHHLKSRIVQTILAWRPMKCYIEANAAQILLVEEVRKSLGIMSSCVVPVWTLGTPEDSVEEGVSLCVSAVESGMATFPYLGQDAFELTEQMATEIVNFPAGRFTDVLMSWVIMKRGRLKSEQTTRKVHHFAGISRAVAQAKYGKPQGMSSIFPVKPPEWRPV